jgi:tetratricopeptide (TPR) repeat protein
LESLKWYQKMGKSAGAAACLNNLGALSVDLGDYDKAEKYYFAALKIREDNGEIKEGADVRFNLATLAAMRGDYSKGAELFLETLKIRERIGDKPGIAGCLNNLGNLFNEQEDYVQARHYFLKALKIREQMGDKAGVASCLNNLGNLSRFTNDSNQAMEYYLASLKLREQIGDKNGMANVLNSIGKIYADAGQLDKAEDYYVRCMQIVETTGDQNLKAYCLGNWSEIMLKTGRTNQARLAAQKGLSLAQEVGNLETMRANAFYLANADSAAGDFQSSLKHFKLYHQYHGLIHNDEQTKKITALQSRYELEKELDEKKRQEEIASAQEAERQERVYMFQSLGIFGFLALMLFSLFFLGKLNLPYSLLKGLMFVSLIMAFEFAVMLFDPWNEKYSQGLPLYKMLFNTMLALVLWPLHNFAEKKLTARLIKNAPPPPDFKRPFDGRE